MARTVKAEEHAAKRNEILDTVLKLIYSKGYERMTIQDILNYMGMSSGAFYHYFDSKPAVLDAFIERMQEDGKKSLLPLLHAKDLSAIEKLQGFFDTINNMRIAQKTAVIELIRVWYNDDNAIVRQKVEAATELWRVPLLTEIVTQGIEEKLFNTSYPEYAGQVIFSLLQGMANFHAKLMLAEEMDEASSVEAIVASHAAYMDAIERLLGVSHNALYRLDSEAVSYWMRAVRGNV